MPSTRGENAANLFMLPSLASLRLGGCDSYGDMHTLDVRSALQHSGIVPCLQHARHVEPGCKGLLAGVQVASVRGVRDCPPLCAKEEDLCQHPVRAAKVHGAAWV